MTNVIVGTYAIEVKINNNLNHLNDILQINIEIYDGCLLSEGMTIVENGAIMLAIEQKWEHKLTAYTASFAAPFSSNKVQCPI